VHSALIAFGEAFGLLFPVVNPAAVAPIFVSFTAGRSAAERTALLRRVVLIVGVVLIAFAIAGEQLLSAMGISLEALQIAGGVIIAYAGFRMVTATDDFLNPPPSDGDPAFAPLAIPLLAGPGAMAGLLSLESREADFWASLPGVIAAILAICALVYLCLGAGELISRKLGRSGLAAMTLIFGLLVMAIGVEMIVHGIATHGAVVES
jgi:multiple antibiotic resistance protein